MPDELRLKTYLPHSASDESELDPNTSYAQILGMIEGAPRIVDVGCGPGSLARHLSKRGCVVVGVDINEEHAVIAREYCSHVLVADLESASLVSLFPSDRFDVAIFADILEHLRNPERLLAEVARVLRPGGFVIASVPNIAHGSVRLSMLQGRFEYQELGILDESHLRFFTWTSLQSLLAGSGLLVESVARTTAPIFEPSGTLVPAVDPNDFSTEVIARVEDDPESRTLQFVVKAVPAASSEARYLMMLRERNALREHVGRLEAELEALRRLTGGGAELPTPEHYQSVLARLHRATTESEELRHANVALEQRRDSLLALLEELSTHFNAVNAEREVLKRDSEMVRVLREQCEGLRLTITTLTNDLAEAQRELSAAEAERAAATEELRTLRADYLELKQAQAANRDPESADEVDVVGLREADAERMLRDLRIREEELLRKAALYEHVIGAMRRSKFWRLRNGWFGVKRLFGVTSDIS